MGGPLRMTGFQICSRSGPGVRCAGGCTTERQIDLLIWAWRQVQVCHGEMVISPWVYVWQPDRLADLAAGWSDRIDLTVPVTVDVTDRCSWALVVEGAWSRLSASETYF